jgi:hypothetical protein
MFEPHWNPTVGAIPSHDKFALAGYWAQLTTCTPTWVGQAVDVYKQKLLEVIPAVAAYVTRHRPEDREFIERAIAEGRIVPNVDDNQVKAILTQQPTQTINLLYQMDWVIIKNATLVPFVTSDNPSSVIPQRTLNAPLVRFLPLAPDLGIMAATGRSMSREGLAPPDLSKPPPGTIRRWMID